MVSNSVIANLGMAEIHVGAIVDQNRPVGYAAYVRKTCFEFGSVWQEGPNNLRDNFHNALGYLVDAIRPCSSGETGERRCQHTTSHIQEGYASTPTRFDGCAHTRCVARVAAGSSWCERLAAKN